MKKILVVGGAGYIGSHMAETLIQKGFDVYVLDNLACGFKDAVLNAQFIEGDLANKELLNEIFTEHNFTAVMHFAAFAQVHESTINPAKYYQNNVVNTLNLLDTMLSANVKNIIFSSTAAIFGNPEQNKINEEHPKNPINPYGRTKLMIENILQDYDAAYGLKFAALRYFNAAGADPSARLGERHNPETHLIPLVLQTASGKREHIKIFGDNYETKDGTCIRDYIHVVDLCQAHLLALQNLLDNQQSQCFNLGNGNGFSVLDVIETARQVTNKKINAIIAERRAGDPAVLVAESSKIKKQLGWQPQYPNLIDIIKHAWQWETTRKAPK